MLEGWKERWCQDKVRSVLPKRLHIAEPTLLPVDIIHSCRPFPLPSTHSSDPSLSLLQIRILTPSLYHHLSFLLPRTKLIQSCPGYILLVSSSSNTYFTSRHIPPPSAPSVSIHLTRCLFLIRNKPTCQPAKFLRLRLRLDTFDLLGKEPGSLPPSCLSFYFFYFSHIQLFLLLTTSFPTLPLSYSNYLFPILTRHLIHPHILQ